MSSGRPLPADYASRPAPDPATFGLPAEDDGGRDDPLLGQNMVSCNHYRHDFDALRAAPTRVDHGGFLGGEYGQTGEPDAFAATLREVLAG